MANQKTNLTQTVTAFKKLSGVTNTSMFKTELGETIASNIQIGTNTIFGEIPPTSPPSTMYETSSGAIVQRVEFDLVPIFGSTYIATAADSQAESLTSTTHSFALKLKSNYETLGSNNPKVGTAPFINGYFASGSNGELQLIPPSFGLNYLVVLKDQNGTQITTGDDMDWYFDYYAGVLFRQDGDNTTIPVSGSGYIYIGKYADEVISSGSGGGTGNGFPFSGSAEITGSLTVSGSGGVTVIGGPITLTTSSITSVSSSINFTTGSINITSGSIAVSTGSFIGNLTGTSSFADKIKITGVDTSAGFPLVFTLNNDNQLYSDSNTSITYNPGLNRLIQSEGIIEVTSGSIRVITGSISASNGGFFGNLTGIASYATNASTASYVNTLNQNVTINGTVTADTGSFDLVTAQVLEVTYISSSVIYSSGSNIFGDELTDTQTLSGSVYITGPNLSWNGNTVLTTLSTASWAYSASNAVNAQTASFLPVGTYNITSSWAQSASNAVNSQTASFLPIGTYSITASWAQSASNAVNAQTASFLPVGTYSITASWAQSASNAVNSQTASFLPVGTYNITSSWAQSASNAVNSQTASFLPVGTYNITSSWAQSASNAVNSQTASFLPVGTYSITASWAQSASNAVNSQTASFLPIGTYNITSSWAQSASNAVNSQTASFLPVGTYNITSSWAQSASNAVNSQTASYVNTLNQDVTINGAITANAGTSSFNNINITNNAVINGDFFVYGSSSFINVNNLAIEDKFILLNSGSTGAVPNEGGIIVQTTSSEGTAYGTALFYDQTANRWMVAKSSSVAFNDTSITVGSTTDYIVTVSASAGSPTGTPINFGTTNHYYGQMYVQTDTSDIYIYA